MMHFKNQEGLKLVENAGKMAETLVSDNAPLTVYALANDFNDNNMNCF